MSTQQTKVIKHKVKIKQKHHHHKNKNQNALQQNLYSQNVQQSQQFNQPSMILYPQNNIPVSRQPNRSSGFNVQGQNILRNRQNSSSSSSSEENVRTNAYYQPQTLRNSSTLQHQAQFSGLYTHEPRRLNALYPEQHLMYDSVYGKSPLLGKNLYGQTGYATNLYSVQQPYPGQSVYVPQPPQQISERVKSQFQNYTP